MYAEESTVAVDSSSFTSCNASYVMGDPYSSLSLCRDLCAEALVPSPPPVPLYGNVTPCLACHTGRRRDVC